MYLKAGLWSLVFFFHIKISISVDAIRVLWDTLYKGAVFTLIRCFGSARWWLPPVIPGKIDRITTCVDVNTDLFLVKMRTT